MRFKPTRSRQVHFCKVRTLEFSFNPLLFSLWFDTDSRCRWFAKKLLPNSYFVLRLWEFSAMMNAANGRASCSFFFSLGPSGSEGSWFLCTLGTCVVGSVKCPPSPNNKPYLGVSRAISGWPNPPWRERIRLIIGDTASLSIMLSHAGSASKTPPNGLDIWKLEIVHR